MLPHYITQEKLHRFIAMSLEEDIGTGDHSSSACIPASALHHFSVIAKAPGVLAGVELAVAILHYLDKKICIEICKQDGETIDVGETIMHIQGATLMVLQAERLLLNCMQRMSGIATYTRKLRNIIHAVNPHTRLLDTRKTTPNFRMIEKWSVKIGGGENHRMGLYDLIMLKDNHIDTAGGITQAICRTQTYLKEKRYHQLNIEVETRNLQEVEETINAGGIYCIMLDNMPIPVMQKAVAMIAGRYKTEASGNINEKTIASVAACGVDYISVGTLTHSAKSIDISLSKRSEYGEKK